MGMAMPHGYWYALWAKEPDSTTRVTTDYRLGIVACPVPRIVFQAWEEDRPMVTKRIRFMSNLAALKKISDQKEDRRNHHVRGRRFVLPAVKGARAREQRTRRQ